MAAPAHHERVGFARAPLQIAEDLHAACADVLNRGIDPSEVPDLPWGSVSNQRSREAQDRDV